jgi:uncharacterized protein (DUF4213/DUF364 family)
MSWDVVEAQIEVGTIGAHLQYLRDVLGRSRSADRSWDPLLSEFYSHDNLIEVGTIGAHLQYLRDVLGRSRSADRSWPNPEEPCLT